MAVQRNVLQQANVTPRNVWEIGVGPPEFCHSASFIHQGIPVMLFEPVSTYYHALVDAFGHLPHVNIINVALSDHDSEALLRLSGLGSFVDGCASSANMAQIARGLLSDSLPAEKILCCKISHLDHGQIDVCLIDAEASEWKILSQMVSRPRIMRLEVGIGNQASRYLTPNLDDIMAWIKDNHYSVVLQNGEDLWIQRTKP